MLCLGGLDLVGDLLAGRPTQPPLRGITWLAVGSGDPAWDAAAPPADRTRTGLVQEVARVPLSAGQVTYAAGAIDVRVSLPPGVATGTLREVGVFGGSASAMPGSGTLVTHKTHDRIDKAATDTVDREIRLQLPADLAPGARDLVGGLLAGQPGLSGLSFVAFGSDGGPAPDPPTGLRAEVQRVALARGDVRHDPLRHAVVAQASVPFAAGQAVVAEAGVFGGNASPAASTGLLVQRQTFAPVDRSVPQQLRARFTLSLVAEAPVAVPAVVGRTADDARAALVAAGLDPVAVVGDGGGAAAGTVAAQDPAAGASVAEATRVRLTVAAAVTVAVPDVLGMPLAAATAAITGADLVAGDPAEDETDAPRGTVVAVAPPPGSRVVPGTTVTVTVATPPVRTVPDVLGRTPAAAAVLLQAAGFTLAAPPFPVVETGSTAGTIVAQAPAARARAPVDAPVTITLAAPFGVAVPDLTGLRPDAAAAALRAAAAPVLDGLKRPADPPGLTLGATTEQPVAAGQTIGTIVGQSPPAGARVPLYAAVAVVLAEAAPAVVPVLVGLALGPATAALSAAGLALGAVGHRASDTGIGTVVASDPPAGAGWPPGGRVGVVLAVPVTVVVPDVVGLDQAAAAEGLASRGLAVGAVSPVATGPGTRPGQVLSCDPAAGATVDKGSAVAIGVAEGVPNLIGRTRDDAVAAVTGLGLTPSVTDVPSPQPVGTVVSQDPAAGSATTPGQTVTIGAAVPLPVTVPDLVGVSFADAVARLSALGLVLVAGGSQQTSAVPDGAVLTLAPPAGTSVPRGSTVTATLAVAPPVMVTVPSLVGRMLADARTAAAAVPLVVVEVGTEPRPGTPGDTVLTQDPAAGTSVPTGSTVSVVVASVDTSVLVPDLRSLGLTTAQTVAARAGLSVGAVSIQLSLGPAGVVLSQDPLPNSRVPAGTSVSVVVSQAAVRVPDVVGQDITSAAADMAALGLVVRRQARRIVGGDGTVVSQAPGGGAVVVPGSTVTLTFSIEIVINPRGPEFPDPRGPRPIPRILEQ